MAEQTFMAGLRADSKIDEFVLRLYRESAWDGEGPRRLGPVILVDQPRDFETIFKNPDLYAKDYGPLMGFGRSRLTENGREWEIRRDMTHGAFNDSAKRAKRPFIEQTYTDRLSRIAEPTFDLIQHAFLEASIILFHNALGFEVDPAGPARVMNEGRPIMRRMQRLGVLGGTPEERAGCRAGAARLITTVANSAKADGWLRSILGSFEDKGETVPGFSAVEEYLWNMFAAIETSGHAASWTVDRLGLFPDLQEEIACELKDRTESKALEIFICETMRRFPPIPYVSRRATDDTALNGFSVRKGDWIVVSICGLHHNPRYWRNPHSFLPDRAEFRDDTYERNAYAPFIAGPRVCGGAKLAKIEVSAAVKAFLTRFRSRRTSHDARFSLAIALRPVAGPDTLQIRTA